MKLFKIEENDANQRLDKFLKKLFPRATRSLIYKCNRKDKVKVRTSPPTPLLKGEGSNIDNKFRKRDNEYKLQIGDEVKIFLSDKDFDELSTPPSVPPLSGEGRKKQKLNKKDIVFEDGDILVLNKNPGVNVHAGDHKTRESNVIVQVQDYLGEKLNSLTFKPSLIHRVDRDTSGILMIGKKKDILTRLVSDFKTSPNPSKGGEQGQAASKKIRKTYYAVVLGKLSRKEGTIKKKLLRIEGAKNENKVQVSEKGQSAVTHYKLLKEHLLSRSEGNIVLSEIEVHIETGRMHQIRVHMASLGNPIVGDKVYGDKKMNGYFAKNFGLSRQALHAWKIEFFHYGRNKKMKLEAKIKKDLVDFIGKIETSPNPSKGGEIGNNISEKQGYITADGFSYKYIKDSRDIMKRKGTQAEKFVWEHLRNKKLGYKIRRQHIIDNFIADFVCLPKKLIIEIDGEIHDTQKQKDFFRTQKLSQMGYRVIRFTNEEVLSDIDSVISKIQKTLDNISPPLEGSGEVYNEIL